MRSCRALESRSTRHPRPKPMGNSLAPDVQDAFGDQVNITRFTLTGDQVMQVGANMASTGFPGNRVRQDVRSD